MSSKDVKKSKEVQNFYCGSCKKKIVYKDTVRCSECGHRILFKERTINHIEYSTN